MFTDAKQLLHKMIDNFIEEAKANDPGENFLIHYLKSSLSKVEIHDEISLLFFAGGDLPIIYH